MVKLIVAKSSNDVIGKNNDLIWHLPADMRFFTQTTKGHIVIMGRRNWESIPIKYRPLTDRINVVITRNKNFNDNGCVVFHSLEEAIHHYEKDEINRDIFIIGGGQIYSHSLEKNLVDEMLITHINKDFDGDTWFPKIDDTKWNKTEILSHSVDEKNSYDFKVFKYSKLW